MPNLNTTPGAICLAVALSIAGCSQKPSADAENKTTNAPAVQQTNTASLDTNKAARLSNVAPAQTNAVAGTNSIPPVETAKAGEGKADPAADAVWNELLALSKPPNPPADWNNGEPTEAQQEEFKKKVAEAAGIASDKAREFYTKFPNDPRAVDAQKRERTLVMNAVRLGQTNRVMQLRMNPILSDEDKFQARVNDLNRKALELRPKGTAAVIDGYVEGMKELRKEFPNRDELPAQLLGLIRYMEPAKKAEVARYLVDTTTDPAIVEAAKGLLKGLPGEPVQFKFTAIDGREIDTTQMKGKVLLIDFWATWCGPCMTVLPDVKETYAKYKDKGFEIIGISGDRALADLQRVVKREKIAWPQYYDKGGPVSFMEEYYIEGIPTMWLVDKNGRIRDTDPLTDLNGKVEAMLAEK